MNCMNELAILFSSVLDQQVKLIQYRHVIAVHGVDIYVYTDLM